MKYHKRRIRTSDPAATAELNARVEALVPKKRVDALLGDGYAKVSRQVWQALLDQIPNREMHPPEAWPSMLGIRVEIDPSLPYFKRMTPRAIRSERWKAKVAARREEQKKREVKETLDFLKPMLPAPSAPVRSQQPATGLVGDAFRLPEDWLDLSLSEAIQKSIDEFRKAEFKIRQALAVPMTYFPLTITP